jgi:exo-beta-1,3-glucanase (GH17 family)
MSVWLGNYNNPDDNRTAYNAQKTAIVSAIQTYGTDHIEGITVGNEYMLKSVHPSPSFKCSGRGVDTFLNPAI